MYTYLAVLLTNPKSLKMCLRNIWMVPLPSQRIAMISTQLSLGLPVSLHFTVAALGKKFLVLFMHKSMFSSSPLGHCLWPSQTSESVMHKLHLPHRKEEPSQSSSHFSFGLVPRIKQKDLELWSDFRQDFLLKLSAPSDLQPHYGNGFLSMFTF